MSGSKRLYGGVAVWTAVALGGLAVDAKAQFQPGPAMTGGSRIVNMPAGAAASMQQLQTPYPYSPYSPYGGYGWSTIPDVLTGAANLTSSQGQLMVNQQQAFLGREQVKAAKIQNKKSAFDEYWYERERTPSQEEVRQQFNKQRLDRARNNPPQSEIWSGLALNTLLTDLKGRIADPNVGTMSTSPSSTLDEDMLKHINVTSGSSGGNAGLLRSGGKLAWPTALTDDQYKDPRDRISTLLSDAVRQAELNGKVDSGTVRQLQKESDALGKQLRKNVDDLSVSDYIEGKTFINNLDNSITILRRPDVANFVSGKNDLRAKNVNELVDNMSRRGLTFSNALPGDESAYLSLYQSMVNYDNALQSALARK